MGGAIAPEPRPSVVGYEEFQRALRDRGEFFARLEQSASIAEVQNSSVSVVVARNFKLVRPISHGCNGIVYEVKCIGQGHPEFFRDQSYALKAPFNFGHTTTNVPNEFENEFLVSSTLKPHPSVNLYFGHFTDRIPQEYWDCLPPVAKELAFDKVHKRMHACMWIVFEYHTGTLEKFLRDIGTAAPKHPQTAATPWPIVHKYSRDICSALVHLFENQTIHFDIKLDNIVVSSNKEQAILIDLGCAKNFPISTTGNRRAFEIETMSLTSVTGNPSHRAPEILNGLARYRQRPDPTSTLCCDKQPSFELGCILFELAMFTQHPLPGYPAGYGPSGQIIFSFESEEQFPIKPPAFPKTFCDLVRGLLQFDPEKRMNLLEASEVLANLESPHPLELLSFYPCVVPVANDAGAVTTKAVCQILCAETEACMGTLHKALEIEPLFSLALLLHHYLNACSLHVNHTTRFDCHPEVGTVFTGKTASFTTTDVELMRAIINKHGATLPELVLAALWTRHISREDDKFRSIIQSLLKKVPTATIQQPELLTTQISSTEGSVIPSLFLRNVIFTRNEIILGALAHLDSGNIDSALGLVSDAFTLFECEMSAMNKDWKDIQPWVYLPGLLFLYGLCITLADQVALHQHIPTSLSLVFSLALSSTALELKDHCIGLLQNNMEGNVWQNKAEVLAEWQDLIATASALCGEQQSPHTEHQPRACCVFVALWKTFCTDHQSMSAPIGVGPHVPLGCAVPIDWWSSSLLLLGICNDFGKYMSEAVALYQQAATAENSMATLTLGLCYRFGNGVAKDKNKAVTLYQQAADAGNTRAICNLGLCYEHGKGIGQDKVKAAALYQKATDAGNYKAMFSLGLCYERGSGVSQDQSKAVTLYQRAAEAGYTNAMCNLGACYELGQGVGKDMKKALTLYQKAADAGSSTAMFGLGQFYQQGKGVVKDLKKAATLYQSAIKAGHSGAICNLGLCYLLGSGDLKKAATLYQSAIKAGHSGAICNLGLCYLLGSGVDQDLGEAIELFVKAADEHGEARAMCILGTILEEGIGMDRDKERAESFFKRAAATGDACGIEALRQFYLKG
ncbi:sel1 repeat family protein [Pelomyxa schiedti]|nr:sel1 repeat family protein [Pelomyxa schiedti]